MVEGSRFRVWEPRKVTAPKDYQSLANLLLENRRFEPLESLDYGDHGLHDAERILRSAVSDNKRIALYADYDVDGTMSCVSWIWFFKAIGFQNYIPYIPCRFTEGYGLNLDAVKHLIHNEGAEVIITMDTGITANIEAAYCKSNGVEFICTDHHKIQPEKMPDSVILNPKIHPNPDYQELCGCGITFVLLRKLGQNYNIAPEVWNDILALVGMATICDVVPLNPVNHKLAKLGVGALVRSQKPILLKLKKAVSDSQGMDEMDVGFRLGPRINAVGRLKHAQSVIEAFVGDAPDALIKYMDECNNDRKQIQKNIYEEAQELARQYPDDSVLFLGGDWHPGVVGIAASKLAEEFWRPVWLFNNKEGICKGSARSIPGFDVTDAMQSCGHLFEKFGGHQAAGGFSFKPEHQQLLREALNANADMVRELQPELWKSKITYDFQISSNLLKVGLLSALDPLKPFGHGFEEPLFMVRSIVDRVEYYNDKKTGQKRHTVVHISEFGEHRNRVLFFNEVIEFEENLEYEFLISVAKNHFRGQTQISLFGRDFRLLSSPEA